jgi:hypothetical protein
MSWSAFPPSAIIPLGSYQNEFPVSGYIPDIRTRPAGQNMGHRTSGAEASTVRQTIYVSLIGETQDSRDLPHLYSLGSAYVGRGCRGFWHEPARRQLSASLPKTSPTSALVDSIIHVPAEIQQIMAEFARASGRSEGDLWTEAADAWLSSHSYDDDPLPPAPSAALAVPAANRSWDMIDDLLSALRMPPSIPATSAEDRDERAA